ncbi:Spy/CpxP family protein refolding chaperone [Thioalkalivibrio paradoxus]|uniref:Zinc resistance-associated protein n=1 Tax=Thioalkalivibrio paradoxus ARh 1 TaxID=713585 RepID=W0DFV6_9GAMM|nr:Spy/CpxP family protein refolding chaperone [Thioalkalivibrio paradoxus]AHE97231.1 hypothetical protein THITH_01945 [Thioalkalivibrio paradoxus ARh 1]
MKLLFVLLLPIAIPAFAQPPHGDHHQPHHGHQQLGHGHAHGAGAHAPYAGLEERSIKALSEQEIKDLRAGRGMAMALAAELNGYPGPLHTLELARELELTPEQEQRTRQLFAEMQQEAGRLGEKLVDAEEALDRLFREQEATPDSVLKASMEAAELRGQLRATHLLSHLEMMAVLSPEQVERYNTLRGYR